MTESFFFNFCTEKKIRVIFCRKMAKKVIFLSKNEFFSFLSIYVTKKLKKAFCHCTLLEITFKMSYHLSKSVKGLTNETSGTFSYKVLFWRPFCFPRWPPLSEKSIFSHFLNQDFKVFNIVIIDFFGYLFLKKSLFNTHTSP